MEADRPADIVTDRAPIRILFVMIEMGMGGSERLVFNLIRHLDRRRFEPSVAWLTEAPPLPEFVNLGVPLHHVPKRGRLDWRAMRQFARIIREQRIDLVNAHHFLSFVYAYYGAKIANRIRLIYTEHSEADVESVRGKWQSIGTRLLRWADGAVGISEAVSRKLGSHFNIPLRALHTIENGVDVDMFSADIERRTQLRSELNLAANAIVIGHVANFRRNKNHLFLVKGFRALANEQKDVTLLLVGQGFEGDPENSFSSVSAFIEANGLSQHVRMLGYQASVEDLLRVFDIFCLVSYKEGLPLSLIEAMASGLPVIGTDIPGIRDTIEPDVNGVLVPPDNVAALSAALSQLIRDAGLRRRMGEASRRIAVAKYSLARCVRETEALFASAVQEDV
jgi:glycosyltransferase involved in cell wall biosynthesis